MWCIYPADAEPTDAQCIQVDRQMWPTHWASIPPSIITLTTWLSPSASAALCVTAVFTGEGTSVWFLPVFLSGKIQQCFFSMPGNTFQETIRERRERERKGEMLISQQLKADKQGGAQRRSTEPCCDPQLQSSKRDTHFSHHLHQKELLPCLSETFLLHRDPSSGALNDSPGVDVCAEGSFSTADSNYKQSKVG